MNLNVWEVSQEGVRFLCHKFGEQGVQPIQKSFFSGNKPDSNSAPSTDLQLLSETDPFYLKFDRTKKQKTNSTVHSPLNQWGPMDGVEQENRPVNFVVERPVFA